MQMNIAILVGLCESNEGQVLTQLCLCVVQQAEMNFTCLKAPVTKGEAEDGICQVASAPTQVVCLSSFTESILSLSFQSEDGAVLIPKLI